MAIFVSNASGAICWPYLQPIHVHSSTEINFKLFQLKDLLKLWTQYSGSVVPLAMFLLVPPKKVLSVEDGKIPTKKMKVRVKT